MGLAPGRDTTDRGPGFVDINNLRMQFGLNQDTRLEAPATDSQGDKSLVQVRYGVARLGLVQPDASIPRPLPNVAEYE